MSYSLAMIRRALFGCAALLAFAGIANAAGPFVGPNIMYLNVNEFDTQLVGPPAVASNPTGLYGVNTATFAPPGSNQLAFPNMTFGFILANGQFEQQDGKLTMDINPKDALTVIHSLSFDEGGAWSVLGADNASLAQVTMTFNNLFITSVNGVSKSIPVPATFVANYTVNSGSDPFHVNPSFPALPSTFATNKITFTSGGGFSGASGGWDIIANFNIDAALAANGLAGQHVDSLTLQSLDNTLFGNTSASGGLSLASIDKKHLFITGVTTVPEPSTIVLGLLGGFGMLVAGKKFRKNANA